MMRSGLVIATAAALIAGCSTVGPDYKRPEVPLPAAWRTPPASVADLVNTEWWQAFGDEHLARLIDSAIDANRDLRIAALRSDEYAARLKVSQAGSLPIVGYGANASRAKLSQERPNGLRLGASPVLSDFELGGTFSWELDLWGRLRRADEAALADLLSTEEARRGLMLTLVADVASGYIKLLELDRRLQIAEEKRRLREESVTLMDAKRAGGSATRLDVELLRAASAEQAEVLPQIRREIVTTELALSALLGRDAGPIPRRRLDELRLPQLPAGVPADVLTRRPDVAAAEQALVAANARIGVARAAYFPTLSLSAAIGLAADDLRWLFAETARTGNFGGALAGTLFDGGRIEGDVRQAEARRGQAEQGFLKAVQTALLEVEDALSARARADEREQAVAQRLKALSELQRLTVARQGGGQTGKLEVYEADLKVQDGRAAEAEGRRDTLLALVAVYKSMGGGWMYEQERRRSTAQAKTREAAEAKP
jgi:outer membrane protein, multidrug efflux system